MKEGPLLKISVPSHTLVGPSLDSLSSLVQISRLSGSPYHHPPPSKFFPFVLRSSHTIVLTLHRSS